VKIQISRAKSRGAQLVVLGEMFACAYSHKAFIELAEPVELIGKSGYAALGKIGQFLSDQARTHQLWIIGGSLPESHKTEKTESFFNTSLVFNDRGEIVQKYRKLHLFDVSITAPVGSGKPSVRFCESDTLSPGDLGIGLCETPWGFQIGLGICYDIRFPELAVSLREKSDGNMKLLVYPGQFNMITGPLHWQLLGRARAVDTQSFCVLASVARSADSSDYQVCFFLSVIPEIP